MHAEIMQSALDKDYLHPVLVERPSGVIELYHITYVGGSAQLQRWTSLDGLTWQIDTTRA